MVDDLVLIFGMIDDLIPVLRINLLLLLRLTLLLFLSRQSFLPLLDLLEEVIAFSCLYDAQDLRQILILHPVQDLVSAVFKEEGADGSDGNILCCLCKSRYLLCHRPYKGFCLRYIVFILIESCQNTLGKNISEKILRLVLMLLQIVFPFIDHPGKTLHGFCGSVDQKLSCSTLSILGSLQCILHGNVQRFQCFGGKNRILIVC